MKTTRTMAASLLAFFLLVTTALAVPLLTSPENNDILGAGPQLFDWLKDGTPPLYYELTGTHLPSGNEYSVQTSSTQLIVGNYVWAWYLPEGDYSWKVIAHHSDGKNESATRYFSKHTVPAYGHIEMSVHRLEWEPIENTQGYRIKATLPDGSPFYISAPSYYFYIPDFWWENMPAGEYKWRAAAVYGGIVYPYSKEWSFVKE